MTGRHWKLDKRFVGVVLTLVAMLAAGIERAVTLENRVSDHQSRILKLEAIAKEGSDNGIRIIERLARVETLLEVQNRTLERMAATNKGRHD